MPPAIISPSALGFMKYLHCLCQLICCFYLLCVYTMCRQCSLCSFYAFLICIFVTCPVLFVFGTSGGLQAQRTNFGDLFFFLDHSTVTSETIFRPNWLSSFSPLQTAISNLCLSSFCTHLGTDKLSHPGTPDLVIRQLDRTHSTHTFVAQSLDRCRISKHGHGRESFCALFWYLILVYNSWKCYSSS